MNEYLLATLLGVIEGLTEFLPVSSTAHLRLAEAFLGIELDDGYWKLFAVVIQLGSILCLPLYFRGRLLQFLGTFPRGSRGQSNALTHPVGLTAIAFLFTVVPALLLDKVIGDNLESLKVMGWALLIGGVVMWLIDAIFGAKIGGNSVVRELELMSPMRAAAVGLCQTMAAVFPGTSRSMATIAAGELVGLSRPAALEFSFLLSIPTMAAAVGYDLAKMLRSGEAVVDGGGWMLLAIGFVVSFVVAYGVVVWFMNWVRERGFTPFAIYRIALGVFVLFYAAQ